MSPELSQECLALGSFKRLHLHPFVRNIRTVALTVKSIKLDIHRYSIHIVAIAAALA